MPYSITAYGMVAGMQATRKITVHVPADLLERARTTTGQGITATVCEGLQLVAGAEAYRRLRELRGKVTVSVDLDRLREDGE